MIYFAGDFHLGVPTQQSSREREADLCRWLHFCAQEGNEIFLMGDTFDFWFEYQQVAPKGFIRLLGTLASITDKGIPVTMFRGNHDMWMFDYLAQECGVTIISDGMEMERNGKKFFLHHGDGLGPGDRTYKFVRSIFRSKLAKWLFARLHPNAGIALGYYLSRRSRISQKDVHEVYLGDENEFLTQFCIENKDKYNFMIFGHRHLTLDIKISENCRYINAGEWVHGRQYAVFDGNNVQLKTWE